MNPLTKKQDLEKQPKKSAKKKFNWSNLAWALALLGWVGASVIASQLIVSFVMVSFIGTRINEPVFLSLYSAITYALAGALVIFVPWKIKKLKMKTSRDELGLSGLPTWTDVLLAPIGFIVYLVLAIFFVTIFSKLFWFDAHQSQDVGFNLLGSYADQIVAFVSLVIIAPIIEEIIFRGWLYGKIRTRLGTWLSILLVSVLFGILHGQWNVGVNVFAMSAVMCVLREMTGTIWSGIVLHILKNGVAFYLLYINPIL